MKICVTGPRPSKLDWGYDYHSAKWLRLKELFKEHIIENNVTDVYTGMALGVDTVMAITVLELKDAGYDIKLHCVIPCATQCLVWPLHSIELYLDILEKADSITGITEEGSVSLRLIRCDTVFKFEVENGSNDTYTTKYSKELMQKRNKYMVDKSNAVVSVWNGSPGGTGNCVKYAMSLGRSVFNFRPITI